MWFIHSIVSNDVHVLDSKAVTYAINDSVPFKILFFSIEGKTARYNEWIMCASQDMCHLWCTHFSHLPVSDKC